MIPLSEHPEAAAFARAFQERHIDEIGQHLERRRLYLARGRWLETAALESRIGSHVAALAAHGPPALDVAAEQLAHVDAVRVAGAAYATAALANRSRFGELLAALARNEDELLVNGLVLVARAEWTLELEQQLGSSSERVACSAAALLARRRETRPELLLQLAATTDSDAALTAIALALSRMDATLARPALVAATRRRRDANVLAAMVLAGQHEGLQAARRQLDAADVPLSAADAAACARAVVLGGGLDDVDRLVTGLHRAPAEMLGALGALGYVEAVPVMLEHLEHHMPSVRRAAARALTTLTGAALTPDGDGASPDPEGSFDPLCTDPGRWHDYWRSQPHRLTSSRQRYRRGHPWSLAASASALGTLALPLGERQLEADELAARAGTSPLEADWRAARQRAHLAKHHPG